MDHSWIWIGTEMCTAASHDVHLRAPTDGPQTAKSGMLPLSRPAILLLPPSPVGFASHAVFPPSSPGAIRLPWSIDRPPPLVARTARIQHVSSLSRPEGALEIKGYHGPG